MSSPVGRRLLSHLSRYGISESTSRIAAPFSSNFSYSIMHKEHATQFPVYHPVNRRTFVTGSAFLYPRTARVQETEDALLSTSETELANEEEVDKLYEIVEIELRSHENAVLDSYEWFLLQAARELGITVSGRWTPLRDNHRFSLLKSVFVYKKHMVQYEIRTYFRCIQLRHLTGSTADTYLEYVQRNLPEGVAMKVSKCAIEAFPSHLKTEDSPEDSSRENKQEA